MSLIISFLLGFGLTHVGYRLMGWGGFAVGLALALLIVTFLPEFK